MNEDKKLAGQFLRKIERLLRHSVPGGGLEPAASIEHWKIRSRQRRNHRASCYGNSRVLPTCGAFSEVAKRTWEKV